MSADGENWHEVGELVSLATRDVPLPEHGEYHVRKLWTDQLKTHGWYVQLCCDPGEQYLFVDEIEVFRGDDSWLNEPYTSAPLSDLKEHMSRRVTNAGKGPYCPTYLDETSVTGAKYMEAIREGVEDQEYLTMLRSRVDEFEKKGVPPERRRPAGNRL